MPASIRARTASICLTTPARVIVLSVVDAGGFPSPDMSALLQRDRDDIRIHHAVSRDVERLLESKLFDRDVQGQCASGEIIHGAANPLLTAPRVAASEIQDLAVLCPEGRR